ACFAAALLRRLRLAQRDRVDAEPEARRRRTVGEYVAQVRVAHVARDFDALHAVAHVHVVRDDVGRERRREARPPGTAFELRRRVEQRRIAADAVIAPRLEQAAELGAERLLGAL